MLPYRETSDCFLIYKGKLIAKVMDGKYLAFPGGGVDDGETPTEAASREVMEEVGAKLSSLHYMGHMKWVWNPEWAANEKRRKRYAIYQGEDIHFMVGVVSSFVKPTSDEGDAWEGDILMSIDEVENYIRASRERDHPNMENYHLFQLTMLNVVRKFMLEKESGGKASSKRRSSGKKKRSGTRRRSSRSRR